MVNTPLIFRHIQVKPIHPTFVAEVNGVDFSKPVPEQVCKDIADAIHHYGVLLFKKTGLDNERHIEFAKNFGELDSTLQFITPGVKTRLAPFYELWDAGNLGVDGDIIPADVRQFEYNKVLTCILRHSLTYAVGKWFMAC
jgi:alpha-ketoglutarate-dependent 2,4-dichlorophenoxyacetate dioxygenase